MRSTILLIGLLAGIPFAGSAIGQGTPPNIVVILTDDQGYQDLGCFGSPTINTPNIDTLAIDGRRFTDFYVTAPICSPSRASLLTGCYAQRVGFYDALGPNQGVGLDPAEWTIAEHLRAAGYVTAAIGKWHLGDRRKFLPTRHGFDSFFGIPFSHDNVLLKVPGVGLAGLDYAYDHDDDSFWRIPLYRDEQIVEPDTDLVTLTQRCTAEAVRFIHANHQQPFFLYLAHPMPHVPLFATAPFKGRSPGGRYGDVIEELDWSVGEILRALSATGVENNTLVIFTSDNGPWLLMGRHGGSALPLRDGKSTTFEGGMRVPTLMRWPARIPAGTVCREMAVQFDLLPTIANLVNLPLPVDREIDGRDISDLLFGTPGARTPHEAFLYYHLDRLEGIRSGNWKLKVVFPPPGVAELPFLALFDLSTDISEQIDLKTVHPKVAGDLLIKAVQAHDRLWRARRPIGRL